MSGRTSPALHGAEAREKWGEFVQFKVTKWYCLLMDRSWGFPSPYFLDRLTSSTAQGGGGSFKNRNPIGEVGCCESRMAERSHWWIERWLMSPLFLSLFLFFSDLPTYLPTYLSIYLSIQLSIYLSIHPSIHPPIHPSIHPSIHVLRATTACTFSTSQLPKVVRTWCALYILTSKCASGHNGVHFFDISTSKSGPNLVCFVHFDFEMCFAHNSVQFFISHLARWLRIRRFSELTFRPSGATNHLKNTVFRDFPTFSRICIFFLLTLSLLSSSFFCSSLLSASAHLCFSSVHIVGSLTSKLPSINLYYKTLAILLDTFYVPMGVHIPFRHVVTTGGSPVL